MLRPSNMNGNNFQLQCATGKKGQSSAGGVLEKTSSWRAYRGFVERYQPLRRNAVMIQHHMTAKRDLNFQLADRKGFSCKSQRQPEVGTEVGTTLTPCFYYEVPTSILFFTNLYREERRGGGKLVRYARACTRKRGLQQKGWRLAPGIKNREKTTTYSGANLYGRFGLGWHHVEIPRFYNSRSASRLEP